MSDYDPGSNCVHGLASCDPCLDSWSRKRRKLEAELAQLRAEVAELKKERDRLKADAERERKNALRWGRFYSLLDQLFPAVDVPGPSGENPEDDEVIATYGSAVESLRKRAEAAEAQVSALKSQVEAKDAALRKCDRWFHDDDHCDTLRAQVKAALSATSGQSWEAEIRRQERELVVVQLEAQCPLKTWDGRGGMPYHDSCAVCRAADLVRALGAPSEEK